MIYVLGVNENKKGPTFNLYRQKEPLEETPFESIALTGNTMILFNSRAFEYEFIDANAKTLMLYNAVPGPAQPPVNPGPSFIDN